MLTSRITEGEKSQIVAVIVMAISVCFSWALDPYTFTLFCLSAVIIL